MKLFKVIGNSLNKNKKPIDSLKCNNFKDIKITMNSTIIFIHVKIINSEDLIESSSKLIFS